MQSQSINVCVHTYFTYELHVKYQSIEKSLIDTYGSYSTFLIIYSKHFLCIFSVHLQVCLTATKCHLVAVLARW